MFSHDSLSDDLMIQSKDVEGSAQEVNFINIKLTEPYHSKIHINKWRSLFTLIMVRENVKDL